jgi:hypothetical protein
VNCNGCGDEVPADAGFCRNCGAILRGKFANIVFNPGSLADTRPPTVLPSSEETHQGTIGPRPPGTSSGNSRPVRHSASHGGYRYSSALDYGVLAAAVLVLVSLALNWYQATVTVRGVRQTVTLHLLSGNAGIQRPLVPTIAGLIVAEVLANRIWFHKSQQEWKFHRGAVLSLCTLSFLLVGSCMLSSPLSPNLLANIGISINVGPGSWVALLGAVAGIVVALVRMFSGRPGLAHYARRPASSGA